MSIATLLKHYAIGLTGGIACGKSTVAEILRREGFVVIDADELSRRVLEPGSEGLGVVSQTFGRDILNPDGSLDRAKMRQLVFQDAVKRQKLEAIVHPRLEQKLEEELQQHGLKQRPKLWFYEASLIFERARAEEFREVWAVYCPIATQIERLIKRDACSRSMADSILAAQMPAERKAQLATRVIHSDCSDSELRDRVLTALEQARNHSDR